MYEVRPWSRQEDESSPAYEAFARYRDMGVKRSLAAVARDLSKDVTLMRRWSAAHGWVARSAAWDSMPADTTAEAHAAMAARIAAQHEALATKLMGHLLRSLELLPEGQDPTIRFSTAVGAARQSHQFATELGKPMTDARAEVTRSIETLVLRLSGQGDES